jgi:hypothetical protein
MTVKSFMKRYAFYFSCIHLFSLFLE